MRHRLLVVAGPTASGKSALALALAEAFDGVVINADSMQIYRELPILSAAPTAQERARVPHRLYGVMSAAEVCSAGRWRDMAAAAAAEAWAAGRLPILCGGTGLYIAALTEGLSPIPPVPEAAREAARALLARLGNAAFHALLARHDPAMAARLDPGNSQRLVRAWEVLQATGRSLAEWQALPPQGGVAAPSLTVLLMPPREALYAAIDRRFLAIFDAGGLDEVRALDHMGLAESLPAMKALGMPQLRRHLRGELGREAAIAAAQQATRNFAKRQATWFRHRTEMTALRLAAQFSESLMPRIFPIIRQFLLTVSVRESSLCAPRPTTTAGGAESAPHG